MTVTGWNCDVCGEFVNDRWRTRHRDCPPPLMPESFYLARQRARRIAETGQPTGTANGWGALS